MWKSGKMNRGGVHLMATGALPYSMQPVKYLTTARVESFFRAIPREEHRDRLMFDVIYRHGLRRTEATLLRDENTHGDRIWIGRIKNGVSGEYPLHPVTRTLLTTYRAVRLNPKSPYLLTSRQSREKPLSPSTINQRFKKYASKAGIPKDLRHVHVLRHSIAVHLLNANWGAEDVQDWLGHKCISSTMVYAKVSNQRRERNYEDTLESSEIARSSFD